MTDKLKDPEYLCSFLDTLRNVFINSPDFSKLMKPFRLSTDMDLKKPDESSVFDVVCLNATLRSIKKSVLLNKGAA